MTVSTSTSKSGPYAGAGLTGPFTVEFYFLENSHLLVIKTTTAGAEVTLSLGSDYTVSGAGNPSGGSVTTSVAVAVGEKLTILRQVPFTQDTDYTQSDSFPAESHERALDKLTMEVQQVNELAGRALAFPASESVNFELPQASSRALRVLGFDASGRPTVLTRTGDSDTALTLDLLDSSDGTKGAGMVGFDSTNAYAAGTVGGALLAILSAHTALAATVATLSSNLTALQATVATNAPKPGDIKASAALTADTGWLLIDGKTIGNAGSGATSRAHEDTLNLFTVLWGYDASAVPIYDSTGSLTTRTSAIADFYAGKRLPLFTSKGGAFIEMWATGQTVDPSRVVGSVANANGGTIPFTITANDGDSQTGAGKGIARITINGQGEDVYGWAGGETRPYAANVQSSNSTTKPYSLALPHYIHL